MNRIRITIEGPQGCGKSQIRRAVEAVVSEMGKTCKTFDPIYKYKPDQVDFGTADVIIMVRQKNCRESLNALPPLQKDGL